MIVEEKLGWDFTVINGDMPSLPLPQELCSPLTTESPLRRAWDFKWVVMKSEGISWLSSSMWLLWALIPANVEA